MDATAYLQSLREQYVAFFRDTVRDIRNKVGDAAPEVLIQSPTAPGDAKKSQPILCDIVSGPEGQQKLNMLVTGESGPGPRVGELAVDGVHIPIYQIHWETSVLSFRHPEPDFDALHHWLDSWRNPDTHPADDEGIHGIVHYLGEPVHDGGATAMELDLGTAPLEALIELFRCLIAMGATEIQLGQSDGSDMDPVLAAELRDPNLSLANLCRVVVALLRRFPEVEEVTVKSDEEIMVRDRGNDSHTLYLSNTYRRLLRVGVEARAGVLYDFLHGQRNIVDRTEEKANLSQLRPVIKDRTFFDNIAAAVAREGAKSGHTSPRISLAQRPLAGDLVVTYVWDELRSMRFVTESDIDEYGLSVSEVHDRAVKNFLEDHRHPEISNHGCVRVVRTRDSYEASLLLDNDFWRDAGSQVKGRLLACAPARDFLLFSGTGESPTAVRQLTAAVRRIIEGGDHLISKTILERDGRDWRVYQPPANSPLPAAPPPQPRGVPVPGQPPKPWWRFW